ncbi:MAG TPA: carbohydrate-binding family 9-like protein [Planctomycetota bacterium]|nr:carbohydrate-binding family 9-like protein [Planctomycetota bacterium]
MRASWPRLVRASGLACVLAMLGSAGCTFAGEIINDTPRPALDVPRAAATPKLDASAKDPTWNDAAVVPKLVLSLGDGGKGLEAVSTEVRLLWDDANLYVRFICADTEIFAPHPEHDGKHYEGDVCEIFFDPVGDQRQYFELQVSPDNHVLDQVILVTGEPKFTPALTFDWGFSGRNVWFWLDWTMEGFRTATSRIEKDGKVAGWIVDAAVPAKASLKRLGTGKFAPDKTMRINFLRYERPPIGDGKRSFIAMNWAPVIYGCPHVSPAAMGSITLKK